ncbi:thiamine biosynthesis protein MoeB [Bacillus sp. AFS015802]|uniref:MoeB/ThiF family adenylyltransferase n=1 Tax=Bacillus sp. AFS015802 TaxID=2033486 RepID=UPI000BF75EB6|nr:MoeB/ThiF family adenylyltransferase [Bacillus sp. AFS015802]PFA69672.1 thiamine biosynthesis protein MoeB [Bacillus sp. AFS015802]
MSDRYSRQQLFKPIGKAGQEKIAEKHVIVIGAGALGSSNAETLVRAGVGRLTIIDRDYVEISNLHRQQLYTENDAMEGLPKAVAAKNRLNEINSGVHITPFVAEADIELLSELATDADLLLDCTDNFDIRFIINDISLKYHVPWIYGSCVGSTGMSYTILPGKTPCLNCLTGTFPMSGGTCDSSGIIAPVVQMVAAYQSIEALKLLVEDQEALRGGVITFDLWGNQSSTMNVSKAKRDGCPSCGENPVYPYLQFENRTKTTVLCGRDTVQIRSPHTRRSLNELERNLEGLGEMKRNPYLLSFQYDPYRIVFFHDGRTFIHGTNDMNEAKTIYHRLIG